jgi:hypothetical protein
VSIPARCRAAEFSKPAAEPSATAPDRQWRSLGDSNSGPSASEADALYSNELRERIVGPRPGNRTRAVYGDLPLRAYKAQPHASAGAVLLVRVA